MKLLIINGPNLNMLGKRDKSYYGEFSLEQLNGEVSKYAATRGATCEFFFSNHEGAILDKLQQTDAEGVILNAGGYTHTSVALRDCVECISVPVVEVHLSDISKREQFRQVSLLADVCVARYFGEKENSYFKAVDFLCNK